MADDIQTALNSSAYADQPSMRNVKWLVIFVALLLFPISSTYAWQGYVARVIDGDTVEVLRNKSTVKIRLYGIDAPERDQPFGRKATKFTANLLNGKNVIIEEIDRDRYGRSVSVIRLGQQNINQALVQEGYAWVYSTYCKKNFCGKWRSLEAKARFERKGLWIDENPVPPWDWRKRDKPIFDRILDLIQDIIHWINKIMSYVNIILRLLAN